jgi:PLP dependent protein
VEPLSESLSRIEARIAAAADRSGRPRNSVRILAVTKGHSVDRVREAIACGLREIGESRVQEAEGKIAALGGAEGVRWHLIGHLQTNKARRAVQLFDEIHSVDSEHLVDELARRVEGSGRAPVCYVEVNTSGETAKHGVAPEGALSLLGRLRSSGLRTAGLMTIGPLEGGIEGARVSFRRLARLRDEAFAAGLLGPESGLSMGMSDDFEVAIEEGATIVRIGSALFGPREGSEQGA